MRYIPGVEDASANGKNVGTVNNPVKTAADMEENDPIPFSYHHGSALRLLAARLTSSGGGSSTCIFSRYTPTDPGDWSSGNVEGFHLKYNNAEVIKNPHGLAQVGSFLYTVDYETQNIVIIGTNELESVTAGGSKTLGTAPYSLSGVLNDGNAKGQAIVALKIGDQNYLYVLYLSTNQMATAHNLSHLVRIQVTAPGVLSTNPTAIHTLGKNAQAIIPVINGSDTWLLIPCIGGVQKYDGTTNGTDSRLDALNAADSSFALKQLLTGDAATQTPPTYDIQMAAASMRGSSGIVFILTGVYAQQTGSRVYQRKWVLYQTTVAKLLSITASGGISLTNAVSGNYLTEEDRAATSSPSPAPDDPYAIYFWDILYEQTTEATDNKDRLWFARGTPIMATPAGAYGSPTKSGTVATQYKLFDTTALGNKNVNGVDLTIETVNQLARGVSLKRTLRGVALPAAAPEEEE
jgi:hypothetical protein